jgi:tRNA-dihydrouridine synthase
MLNILTKIANKYDKEDQLLSILTVTNQAEKVELLKNFISHLPLTQEDWTLLDQVLIDNLVTKTVIIGNGDVNSYSEGLAKIKEFDLDGVMIGRGIFQNPYFFHQRQDTSKEIDENSEIRKRLNLLLSHLEIWQRIWIKEENNDKIIEVLKNQNVLRVDPKELFLQNRKHFPQLKKYFKIYIQGFNGAVKLREELMKFETVEETIEYTKDLLKKYEK